MYYRGAQAAIVVYDITNQVGFSPIFFRLKRYLFKQVLMKFVMMKDESNFENFFIVLEFF